MPHQLNPTDIALVRSAPIFAGLPPAAFEQLLGSSSIKLARRGELLFVQGDPVNHCFIVLDGWVKIYRLTPAGGEAVLAVFTRGQSFAEAAAFVGGRFPASGEAVTDCRLLRLPVGHLLRMIRETPEIGLSMLASTSQQLHMLVQQIEQLKSHTGAQRVAEFLASLSEQRSGACEIALPYDKVLIAGRLGMQPESLSRAFARLKQIGVQINQNVAVIDDMEKLLHYADKDVEA